MNGGSDRHRLPSRELANYKCTRAVRNAMLSAHMTGPGHGEFTTEAQNTRNLFIYFLRVFRASVVGWFFEHLALYNVGFH